MDTNSEKIQECAADMGHGTAEDENQKIPMMMMTVFSNELIWKTLGRCLNVSDLKCCRLVNRKFNEMVMDETKFKDRVVLKIKKKKLTLEEFGRTEENWKKISLNFPLKNASNVSNYDWLYPLLTDVEYLSLRLHGNTPSCLTAIDFHPLLGRLLASCKKLKSLAVEPDFIRTGRSRICEGTETLEKLEQLEILQPHPNRKPLRGDENTREQDDMATDDFCMNISRIKIYKSYFPQFRINRLEPGGNRTLMEAAFLSLFIDFIVLAKGRQLVSHSFYDLSHPTLGVDTSAADFMHKTPALTTLEADPNQLELSANVINFITYLNHRPLLEQLDISCHFYDPVDSSVLSDIMHSVARHSSSLQKLKLWITLANLSDWIFLRESSLRELRLEDHRTVAQENEWIRPVMTNVPKSIERLYLRGAALEQGQEKQKSVTEPLKAEYFARLDPQLVTQLSIFNAGGLVDNSVAEFICKTFKMLRKLNVSQAQTDDEGFSEISEMKGLQFLTLKRCGISDVTLKRIRFLELRYLDVCGNLETTAAGIKMTMKKCPSLETVIITPVREHNFTKEDGQKICPRLKFLIQSNDGAPPDQ